MKIVTLTLLLLVSAFSVAQTPEQGIRDALAIQSAAWNRGDLEAYMQLYWKSPEMAFVGGNGMTRGWQATFDRYKKRYQSDGREMGQLTYDIQDITLLADGVALVTGGWKLQMSGKNPQNKDSRGMFSIVLRRLPEGWRIVHDHSSSATN